MNRDTEMLAIILITGTEKNPTTYYLSAKGKKVISLTCRAKNQLWIGRIENGTWKFYAKGNPLFELPKEILKRFQEEDQLL